MTAKTEVPSLPAYRTSDGIHLMVWCKGCGKWHSHGACGGHCNPERRDRRGFLRTGTPCTCLPGTGDGHRVAHCHDSSSPYARTGYTLREVGPFTARVEKLPPG